MARNMTEYVFSFNKVKKNILTSLGVKLREKIILLNKYKNLSSEGASTSEFKFLESEVLLFPKLRRWKEKSTCLFTNRTF